MQRAIFQILLIAASLNLFGKDCEELFDLQQLGYEQYEDIYVRGQVIKKASYGERYEDDRFAIVNHVLEKYQRPFTMLDIGSAQGYFTFRAADMYPESVFVMLEGNNRVHPIVSKQIASICQLNNYLENVIWLDTQINPPELAQMFECEHFDIILALNILHWFPNEWKMMLDAFQKMSHNIIIEVPPSINCSPLQHQLIQGIHDHLAGIAKEIIVGVPRHIHPSVKTTYYLLENNNPAVFNKPTLMHEHYYDRSYTIHCDYHSKTLIKTKFDYPFYEYTSEWIPGINLLTFLSLHGGYPLRQDLINRIPDAPLHNDWMPNNMILQGSKLQMIDLVDYERGVTNNPSFMQTDRLKSKIQELILTEDPKQARVFFSQMMKESEIGMPQIE